MSTENLSVQKINQSTKQKSQSMEWEKTHNQMEHVLSMGNDWSGISQCGYRSGQVSTVMSHHLSPIKMAVIKASKRQQGLEGPEEVEDGLHPWW